jgi:hypothetical protein
MTCFTYPSGNWQRAADHIMADAGHTATMVIGHSGGGSCSTWVDAHETRNAYCE